MAWCSVGVVWGRSLPCVRENAHYLYKERGAHTVSMVCGAFAVVCIQHPSTHMARVNPKTFITRRPHVLVSAVLAHTLRTRTCMHGISFVPEKVTGSTDNPLASPPKHARLLLTKARLFLQLRVRSQRVRDARCAQKRRKKKLGITFILACFEIWLRTHHECHDRSNRLISCMLSDPHRDNGNAHPRIGGVGTAAGAARQRGARNRLRNSAAQGRSRQHERASKTSHAGHGDGGDCGQLHLGGCRVSQRVGCG